MTTTEHVEESEFCPSIETRRLALAPTRLRDNADMAKLLARPRIAEGLAALPDPRSGEIGESFVIIEREGGRPIGAALYGPVPDRPAAIEIACCIGENDWGRGYATEAMQAVIDRAFADARIDRLWCANRVMNPRARRVIEKCGFQFRGTGMARAALGGAVAVERFDLERSNWAALKAWGAPPARKDWSDEARDTAA